MQHRLRMDSRRLWIPWKEVYSFMKALDVLGSTLAALTPAAAGLWPCSVLEKAFFTEARWRFRVTPCSFDSLQTYASESLATALDSGLLSFCIEISSVKDCKIGSFNQKQKYTSWSHLLVNSQAAGKKIFTLYFFTEACFLIHKNSISCQRECIFPGTWLLPICLPPASLEQLPNCWAPHLSRVLAGEPEPLWASLVPSAQVPVSWSPQPHLQEAFPNHFLSVDSFLWSFPVCPLHLLLCPN